MSMWSRVRSWFGPRAEDGETEFRQDRPADPPTRLPSGMQVSGAPQWDSYYEHPGRKLNPAKLLAAYDLADDGEPIEMLDIFADRIEADASLRGDLENRVDSVARKTWQLQEGGDSAEDKKAAQMLEERLRLVPNLLETFEHQLRFNWYGWSATEIDWRRVEGVAAPVWFENVLHRRFRFDPNDRLLLVTKSSLRGEPLRRGKWWVSARSGRRKSSSGLMRTCAWWSMFKSYAVRDWLVWANRFGIPSVYGVYDGEAQPEDIATLKKAVKALGRDGWSVFSDACKIVVEQATQGGKATDVHGAMTELCDGQNAKLVNGATLMTSTGGPGSFALGKVHADRGFSLLSGDASRLSESFEAAVGLPFVRYNGLSARPPRLKIHLVQDQSPETRAKVFAMARNEIGVALDEDQVRQELQLKAPTGKALLPPATPQKGADDGDGAEEAA